MEEKRGWILAVLLGVVGFGLNLLDVPLLPGLQLLFGAVPAYMVASAYGPGPGALAGAIAALRTLTLWGHPYGWILLALEAGAVGLLRNRVRPVFAVGAFWLVAGFWLGMLADRLILDVPWFDATITMLKLVLNGLTNALLAEGVLLAAPARRALGLHARPAVRQYLGVLSALAATIPLLSVWILGTHQQAATAFEAADAEARMATGLFRRVLATLPELPTPARPSVALAAIEIPGITLKAYRRGDGVFTAVDGSLMPDPRDTTAPGAILARRLVAAAPEGSASYVVAGAGPTPFVRSFQRTLVLAEGSIDSDWLVWSEVPYQRILGPLSGRLLTDELVMIGALLVALVLALLVARQLEGPIGALMAATRRLAAGDLKARVERAAFRHAPAEPLYLASWLDAMAQRVEEVEAERSRLLDAERAARAEAERRVTEESALRRAAEAMTASDTVADVLCEIAANAVLATSADGAYVERVEAERGTIRVAAVAGEVHPPPGAELPFEGSHAQEVLRTGEPEVVPVVGEADPPLAGGMAERYSDHAAVVLPLLESGLPIGALLLLRRSRNAFSPDEVRRAATFANLAALAFRKVHLLEESEQRREQVEHVMESRARLMRGFSHDVKNPLGAADGYLQLLEDEILGELAPRQKESVGRVRRALSSALALIDDLVELARAEAGQLEVTPETLDAAAVAREITAEYRAQAAAAGLALEQDLPPAPVTVRSDGRRVRQVLGNLLSNAVKYTPSGGRIGLRVAPRPGDPVHPGQWVAVDVWDTGRGIPPERGQRIFEEFTRLEPGRTPGAGLGLAISRRVARAIGGDLTYVSQPGDGSTFTLWLPKERATGGD
jgi:signal transduction histidine kinase/HAMP domain-containing protein